MLVILIMRIYQRSVPVLHRVRLICRNYERHERPCVGSFPFLTFEKDKSLFRNVVCCNMDEINVRREF